MTNEKTEAPCFCKKVTRQLAPMPDQWKTEGISNESYQLLRAVICSAHHAVDQAPEKLARAQFALDCFRAADADPLRYTQADLNDKLHELRKELESWRFGQEVKELKEKLKQYEALCEQKQEALNTAQERIQCLERYSTSLETDSDMLDRALVAERSIRKAFEKLIMKAMRK